MAHITHIGKQFKMIGILATGGDFSGRGGGGGCVEEKGGYEGYIFIFLAPLRDFRGGVCNPAPAAGV